MKKLRIAVVFLSFAAGISGQPQPTLDDIIAGYLKTVGGADCIQALQTVRRTGKFLGAGGFEKRCTGRRTNVPTRCATR